MEVKRLDKSEVAAWATRLYPTIAAACLRSNGRYAPHHVLEFAGGGQWQIWLVLEGDEISFVCGTEIIEFPTGLKAIAFRFGTGTGRERWQDRITDVFAWAKAEGCTMAEGFFRKGWKRVLPGWIHSHEFLERRI